MSAIVDLPNLAATEALSRRIAAKSRAGDVIALSGGLGAGKTAFARAFIAALFGQDEDVPSPTFTLVQTYDAPGGAIWHFDLYRLSCPEDARELGIEQAFRDGISLIEWPERLGPWLPEDRLDIAFAQGPSENARRASIVPHGSWISRV